MKKTFSFLLVLLFAGSIAAQDAQKMADSVRKYRNIPGLVYAVFTTDAIIDSGVSGIKKLKTKDPVRWKNRFQIGGSTTGFTAYVAARMVEEGKIKWNTPIIKLFPELDGKTMKLYHKITLEQWLSMRAGQPPYEDFNQWRDIHSLPGNYMQQSELFVEMMLKRRPTLIVDSSKAVYSVASVSIAAAMLERAAKKPWEQLVEQYVNGPLKIKAEFGLPAVKDSSQPWGHWDTYFALTTHADDYWGRFFPPIAPAGNINISMDDFITFVRDHLESLKGNKSVIGKNAAEQLFFSKPAYSVGWFNTKWRDMNIAYLNGRGGLYSSYVEIIKEKGIGIIVMCNSGTVDGRSGVSNLGKLLRHKYGGM